MFDHTKRSNHYRSDKGNILISSKTSLIISTEIVNILILTQKTEYWIFNLKAPLKIQCLKQDKRNAKNI